MTLNVDCTTKFGAGVPASTNVNVICTGPPLCPAAGVNVTVQFGAVPPNTTFAVGITVVSEDEAVTEVEQFNVESTSEIVNAKAAVATSSFTV